MIPKREINEREATFDIRIEDVEKVLNKNYKESGSADRAVAKLKKILDDMKNN